jgi:hypothetical protein
MSRYDYDDLTGKPKGAALGIARKLSMSYSFVRHVEPIAVAGETAKQTMRRDVSSERTRQAKQRPHATSDLSLDGGLRERRALLNGITRKHTCQGKSACKCGKLAAKPSKGIGMAGFMRNVVRQGKRRHWRTVRQLNTGRENAAKLLAIATDSGDVKAVAPLLRNYVRIVRKDDRNLL